MPWTISPLPPYLFQSVWQSLCPSMLLQMALVPSFLWLSNIPLRACTTPSVAAPLSVDIWLASMSWLLWWAFWTSVLVGSSGHTHHIYSVCLLTVSRKEISRACLGYRGRSIFPSFPTYGRCSPCRFSGWCLCGSLPRSPVFSLEFTHGRVQPFVPLCVLCRVLRN